MILEQAEDISEMGWDFDPDTSLPFQSDRFGAYDCTVSLSVAFSKRIIASSLIRDLLAAETRLTNSIGILATSILGISRYFCKKF